MQNAMNKKTIVAIVVLAVAVVGLTAYWQFFSGSGTPQPAQVINSLEPAAEPRIITALHQFSKGKHIIAGEVELPTPCHISNQNVTFTSVDPEIIKIDFVTTAKDESLCAQVLTSTRYKINIPASEGATFTATWNGEPATLNLVPVSAGESLENFDVFIKG